MTKEKKRNIAGEDAIAGVLREINVEDNKFGIQGSFMVISENFLQEFQGERDVAWTSLRTLMAFCYAEYTSVAKTKEEREAREKKVRTWSDAISHYFLLNETDIKEFIEKEFAKNIEKFEIPTKIEDYVKSFLNSNEKHNELVIKILISVLKNYKKNTGNKKNYETWIFSIREMLEFYHYPYDANKSLEKIYKEIGKILSDPIRWMTIEKYNQIRILLKQFNDLLEEIKILSI